MAIINGDVARFPFVRDSELPWFVDNRDNLNLRLDRVLTKRKSWQSLSLNRLRQASSNVTVLIHATDARHSCKDLRSGPCAVSIKVKLIPSASMLPSVAKYLLTFLGYIHRAWWKFTRITSYHSDESEVGYSPFSSP